MTKNSSSWVTNGEHLRLSLPIAKVDKVNRTVSGYATADNADSQDDIVLAEASTKAFARSRHNLREMHQNKAVGRIVDFKEDEVYDQETDKFYQGVYVTAYVSKGAQDTWEKVLDGTLSGFSIGGNIIDSSDEFVKESGRTIRYIKDYELDELSLVDNPANILANVLSFQKSADGSVAVKGMAAEVNIENVFWCTEDKAVKSSSDDYANCLECGNKMENIGWFESGSNRAEKVKETVAKFLGLSEQRETKGGVEMGTETKVEEVTKTETVDETASVKPEDKVEKAEPNAELLKQIGELKDATEAAFEKDRTEVVAAIEQVVADFTTKIDEVMAKTSELDGKFAEFGEKLEASKAKFAEFEKSLETINTSEAFKKSSDPELEETVQKTTIWNGAFSVDNLLR